MKNIYGKNVLYVKSAHVGGMFGKERVYGMTEFGTLMSFTADHMPKVPAGKVYRFTFHWGGKDKKERVMDGILSVNPDVDERVRQKLADKILGR